jgi:hypothetical protein
MVAAILNFPIDMKMVIHVQFIICGVGSLVSGEIFPELSLSPLLRNIQQCYYKERWNFIH